jgi:AcrR family transcriptional regulator
MVLAEPDEPLTIARAAEAIGAAPMSLYRHFTDREDLVVSVAHHLLEGSRPPFDPDIPWQHQVRAWMLTVYERASRIPQLLRFAATGESPAWLKSSSYLAELLEHAGIDDDEQLAEAVYWVATTTMGHAIIHAKHPAKPSLDRLLRNVDDLPPADIARLGRVLPQLEQLRSHAFERVVDWTIAGLEHRIVNSR